MNEHRADTGESALVAISKNQERRDFIEHFVKEHPGITRAAVNGALDDAATRIAPSEDREQLDHAVEEVLGSTDR